MLLTSSSNVKLMLGWKLLIAAKIISRYFDKNIKYLLQSSKQCESFSTSNSTINMPVITGPRGGVDSIATSSSC